MLEFHGLGIFHFGISRTEHTPKPNGSRNVIFIFQFHEMIM